MKDIIKKIIKTKSPNTWNNRSKFIKNIKNELSKNTLFLDNNASFAERFYCILNDIFEKPKCLCGNYLKYTKGLNGYQKNCSYKCAANSENTKKNRIKTNINKYGVKSHNQLNKIKEKKKETYLNKYGVEHLGQSEKIKEKIKQTRLKNIFQNKILKLENIEPLFSKQEFIGYISYDYKYKFKCKICKNIFKSTLLNTIPRCFKCFPKLNGGRPSNLEIQLHKWLSDYITIKSNCRFFHNKQFELDVHIPSHKLGIEFNGLYWHSELVGKNKNYHINKTNWFKENFDIDVIHIFENEWILKQDIVKSIILNRLGLIKNKIYARKCEFKEIDSKQYRIFLEENHIQGPMNSKYKFGLFYESELVSVIGFGKSRFKENELELHRFCNKINMAVVGGFSKLLKNSNFKGITYCDLRYFNAHGYKKIGFKEIKITKPNYWYFNDLTLHNRIQFQKHKLKDKLEKFDPQLTEWENMQMNGWNRIWDCGNMKLEFFIFSK